MRIAIITGIGAALIAVTPALADHNNPWATADDVVQSQYHDVNQLKSVDTPGEDEMYGGRTGLAYGKTGDERGSRGTGSSAGGSKGGSSGGSSGGGSGRGRGNR